MNKIIAILFLIFSGQMAQAQIHTDNKLAVHTEDAVSVTGKVFNARVLGSGMIMLNIGGYFPDHLFEVLIQASDRPKFLYKPEEKFLGKQVQVTGSFMDSKGKLQMTISDPAQLFEILNPKPIPQKELLN